MAQIGSLTVGVSTENIREFTQYIGQMVQDGQINGMVASKIIHLLTSMTVGEVSPDANVERNRKLLLERSVVGLEKYGVTTERTDLTLAQWLQHLVEELLDAANYIQAAKANLASGDRLAEAEALMRKFVQRADDGEIRSQQTYREFKTFLEGK